MATKYRADQVGSFLRPPRLLEARRAQTEGRISQDELRQAEDEAILAVLEMQRQVGIDVYSDGEYRRSGSKVPARSESYSSRKASTSIEPKTASAMRS